VKSGYKGVAMEERGETLLIHLGGLGDVCVSESAFLSLSRHYGKEIRAVGNKRVLDQFADYFVETDSIDSRAWAYLFSDSLEGPPWPRIVLLGKDRQGAFRERLFRLCEELIFIDMYPDETRVAVEEYQLEQLGRMGVRPVRADFHRKAGDRIILYPEEGRAKRKWPVVRFMEVFTELKGRGMNVLLLRPPDLSQAMPASVSFEDLREVAAFFSSQGGVFFSNDSGMAHFAATRGLRPLTLFWEADPIIWAPKGSRVLACRDKPPTVEQAIDFIIWGMV
jgi:ADP-heptose:LPS heptosyltransferase